MLCSRRWSTFGQTLLSSVYNSLESFGLVLVRKFPSTVPFACRLVHHNSAVPRLETLGCLMIFVYIRICKAIFSTDSKPW